MKSKLILFGAVLAAAVCVAVVAMMRQGADASAGNGGLHRGGGVPVSVAVSAAGDGGMASENFGEWMTRRQAGADAAPLAEGVELARRRMDGLAELMRRDPAAAIDRMMSLDELAALPEEVREVCEQPFSAVGSIDLLWATTDRGGEHLDCKDRTRVHAGGESWRAWGPRLVGAPMPRADVPIAGWKIAGELLVAPSPVRRLTGAELAVAGQWFPDGNPDGVDPLTGGEAAPDVAAVIGGRVFRFRNAAAVGQVEEILENTDRIAENERRFKVDSGLGWLEAEGGDAPESEDPVEATPWQDDMLDVLFIRVDFSDFPGEPVSKPALETTLSSVAGGIHDYSYGDASLAYTVTTQLYRMPDTGTSYATAGDNEQLIEDARDAAKADYTLADYDVVAVFFPDLSGVAGSKITYSGLASVGGGNQWINGANSVGVILHEFGHNFGLSHSNYWDPSQGIAGNYKDPNASSLEYGDIFDRMGKGSSANGYFNPYATHALGWLPDSKVAEPRADGTWRIHRFDDPGALSNQYLALRIPMGGEVYYWVGHRKRYGAPYNLANGAYVVAEGLYKSNWGRPDRPNLIDMTPGSAAPEEKDREDAGLVVGSSWNDPASGVTIEVLASGGTAPNEWIDVKVSFESRISVAATSIEVDEQSGVAEVVLRREFSGGGEASVDFATSDGTAVAGSDYYAASGTVKWADGDMDDKTVRISIRPDATVEGSEQFTVNLSNPTGATLDTLADASTVSVLDPGRRYQGFAPGFFNTKVNAIIPLADGRVIIGGDIGAGIGGSPDIRHIARLNADGSVDETFLTGAGFDAPVRALAVQPDGKIVAGGEFTSYDGTACNRVVRLNADGTIDNAFAAATGTGADDNVRAVAVEAGGTILVGGKFENFAGGAASKHLVRLASTGAPDTANPLNLGYSANEIRTILAQSDGKIMVGGIFFHYSWQRSGIARLNFDGTRDTTFETGDGANNGAYSSGNVYSVARQPDGKYLVGGSFSNFGTHPTTNLAIVDATGSPDTAFTAPAFNNVVYALVAQGSGMTMAGGWFDSPAGHIERLDASGSADPNFQQGGGTGGSVYAIAEDAEGALWVGGNFFNYDGASCRPVIRIAGGVPPFDHWVAGHFTPAQIAGGESADTADPDGDGLVNLAEMAGGTDPNRFDANAWFGRTAPGGIAEIEDGGSLYLQVAFEKSGSVPGVWYAAQFSSDLTTWTPANPEPGGNGVYDVMEDSADRFIVRDKTPMDGESRRFVRMVLLRPQ